jgi:hypothetical protein
MWPDFAIPSAALLGSRFLRARTDALAVSALYFQRAQSCPWHHLFMQTTTARMIDPMNPRLMAGKII